MVAMAPEAHCVTGMDPVSTNILLHQLDGVIVLRKPLSPQGLRGAVKDVLAARVVPGAS